MTDQPEIGHIAYHEAGHAVMAYLRHCPFRHVSIIPDDDSWGHLLHAPFPGSFRPDAVVDGRTEKRVQAHVDVSLAGDATILLLTGDYCPNASQDWHNAVDMAAYVNGINSVTEAYLHWRWATVKAELNIPHNWVAIQALAQHLIEKRRVSSREARRVIGDTIMGYHRRDTAALWAESEARGKALRMAELRSEYRRGVLGLLSLVLEEKQDRASVLEWALAELEREMSKSSWVSSSGSGERGASNERVQVPS